MVVQIEEKAFSNLISKINEIHEKLTLEKSDKNEKSLLSGKEVMNLLSVSDRTLFNYRSQGKLAFSQIGSKIFYTRESVYKMLQNHYHEPFKTK
jgi:hypothetical protein